MVNSERVRVQDLEVEVEQVRFDQLRPGDPVVMRSWRRDFDRVEVVRQVRELNDDVELTTSTFPLDSWNVLGRRSVLVERLTQPVGC